MYGKLSLRLQSVNEHLVCSLCGGYYVDATTIIECLHSFCRSCIVNHLATNKCCPKCEVPAHKTRPLLNIRSDKTLQDIVFKLVPNLYKNEVQRKKLFYKKKGLPMVVNSISMIDATGEKSKRLLVLSLEIDKRNVTLPEGKRWQREEVSLPKRYLRCSDLVTIATVSKLVRMKLENCHFEIITFCQGEVLPEFYTLMEVLKLFGYTSKSTLPLSYMAFTALDKTENRESKFALTEDEMRIGEADQSLSLGVASSSNSSNLTSSTVSQSELNTGKIEFAERESGQDFVSHTNMPQTSSAENESVLNLHLGKNLSFFTAKNVLDQQPVGTITKKESGNQHFGTKIMESPQKISDQHTPISKVMNPSSPERTKSINSIAYRLQLKQYMQNTHAVSEQVLPKPLELLSGTTEGNGHILSMSEGKSVFHTVPVQTISSHDRNLPELQHTYKPTTSYGNLTNDEAHNLALECVRNKMRPINPSVKSQFTSRANINNSASLRKMLDPMPEHRNQLIKMKHPHHMDVMNTSLPLQQHKSSHQAGIMSNLSKLRRSREPEDPQLLSTTRQLASLRQQQKMLNEMLKSSASHVASDVMRSTISVSSSPISTHAQMQPVPSSNLSKMRITSNVDSQPNRQQRFLISTAQSSRGTHQPPQYGKVRQRITQLPHIAKNIGYPALNSAREGNIDIYQNTIEKARACVREMNMKQKMSSLKQARSSAAPYNVPRKIQPKYSQDPSTLLTLTTSELQDAPILLQQTSSSNTFHAQHSQSKEQLISSTYDPNQSFASNIIKRPQVEDSIPRLPTHPMQDQPLCLVKKK